MSSNNQAVQRMRPSSAHSKSHRFSADMSKRFFQDGSMGAKERAVTIMKRKQDKMELKRQAQENKLIAMQQVYEENRLKFELQKKRIEKRLEHRRRHIYASKIQKTWNTYVARCWQIYQENCAARILQDFIAEVATKNRVRRFKAAQKIQHVWWIYTDRKLNQAAAELIQYTVRRFLNWKQNHRTIHATFIQQHYRKYRDRVKRTAVTKIQTHFRRHTNRRKIHRLSRVYAHVQHVKKLNRCARIIQRFIGKILVRRTILEHMGHLTTQFELNIDDIRKQAMAESKNGPRIRSTALRSTLHEARKLKSEEEKYLAEIAELEKRIASTKLRKEEEIQKHRRIAHLEKQKDIALEEELAQITANLENTQRKKIRRRLEDDYAARRKKAISKGSTRTLRE